MGITIDKAILRVEHSSMSVDDKETADCIINTMRKYQKIEQIIEVWHQDIFAKDFECIAEVAEVVENGNDDN